jgi:hypothetical protein
VEDNLRLYQSLVCSIQSLWVYCEEEEEEMEEEHCRQKGGKDQSSLPRLNQQAEEGLFALLPWSFSVRFVLLATFVEISERRFGTNAPPLLMWRSLAGMLFEELDE